LFPEIDKKAIRQVIENAENGYLNLSATGKLLDAAGIARKPEMEVLNVEDALDFVHKIGFPVVMKVVGPLHKSDVGGVVLNVNDEETVVREFQRLIQIPDTYAVEINKMLFGTELFIGVSREEKFGHQIWFGLGGIFVELIKDVQTVLSPVNEAEALALIKKLRGYKIFQGIRGQAAVSEQVFAENIVRVSALVAAAPEIAEMDLNPLLATANSLTAVDARIRIEK
jgi:acetyltransferase